MRADKKDTHVYYSELLELWYQLGRVETTISNKVGKTPKEFFAERNSYIHFYIPSIHPELWFHNSIFNYIKVNFV